MNAHKSKLLFKSIVCPPVCFCPLIGCVLIPPPPLGFLTIFFVQNLKFSKSFHMNPELEVIKLFWICKMTNTRRSYNCTFALLNRESVWTGRVLIPPPLGLFRVKFFLLFGSLPLLCPWNLFETLPLFGPLKPFCASKIFLSPWHFLGLWNLFLPLNPFRAPELFLGPLAPFRAPESFWGP